MDFLKPAKYFFILSAILTAASIVLLIVPGPVLSVEFTGGTRMEVAIPSTTSAEISEALKGFQGAELSAIVNKMQNGNFLVRMKEIDNETHKALNTYLDESFEQVRIEQYTTIGPTVGATLKSRAVYAIIAAALGIILYLAFSFRKIPRKYSPWKFGVVAVATLLHDVMITVGVFVILSRYTTFEVDTLFVTALLTILGYSVNDTIIVFDRIRDNLFLQERKEDFALIANRAIGQTWKRSTYTSASTLIMLGSLLFFGTQSTQWFVLTLIVGISLGTYSSIFVATPLLVYWSERNRQH